MKRPPMIKCPDCGGVRSVGYHSPGKYFCRNCCTELHVIGDMVQIHTITLNGILILTRIAKLESP